MPRPLAAIQLTFNEPHAGQNGRGYHTSVWHSTHCGSTSRPSAVASQNGFTSGKTFGAGAGSMRSVTAAIRRPPLPRLRQPASVLPSLGYGSHQASSTPSVTAAIRRPPLPRLRQPSGVLHSLGYGSHQASSTPSVTAAI